MTTPVSSSGSASYTSAASPETTSRQLVSVFMNRRFSQADAEGLAQRASADRQMRPEVAQATGWVFLNLQNVRPLQLRELQGARSGAIKININANYGNTNQWRVMANLTIDPDSQNPETITTVLSAQEYNELYDLHYGRAMGGAPEQMRTGRR